ncbi:TetR family transcriptional regulator [Streptomyces sp. XD-27]|uniref:TetR family transcriptional regulator n=1 Tax=Streptomyces sp. XD-27 TaxID=3062779 RepID=UPI0026F417B8|nr:TetR family transcriptional regulator [Streptomyces sp. XD-27]WKX72488.1 TetR family transcriptional regulator [Streptomyces sp. XD-27]
MPAAREALLDAAFTALVGRPWAGVRMVDVAAAAGVSRQTLYNEFGSKEGLARALVRREADAYLTGIEAALAGPGGADPRERLTAAAQWTVRAADANPLLRAALTGCWTERLPSPEHLGPLPAQRPGAGPDPLPSPGELLGRVRDRAVTLLERDWPAEEAAALGRACETATRLALSCVVAPTGAEDVARLVRGVLPPEGPVPAGPRGSRVRPGSRATGAELNGRRRRAAGR